MLLRTALLLALPLALAATPRAQLLHTTSGETVIGHVDEISDDGSVTVTVGFPTAGSRTFAKGELIAQSVYDAMRATLPMNRAAANRRVARACFDLGLPAQAIAHTNIASKLDPEKKDQDDKFLARLRDRLAWTMIERAVAAEKAGHLGVAHLIGEAITGDYSDSKAAERAKILLDRVGGRVVKRLAGNEAEADKLAAATKNAKRLHDRALELMGADGATMLDYYEAASLLTRAWNRIRFQAPGDSDNALAVREAVKTQLADSHARLAQVALRRHNSEGAIAHAGHIRELNPADPRAAKTFATAAMMMMMTGVEFTK